MWDNQFLRDFLQHFWSHFFLTLFGRKIDQIIGPLVYRATFQNALKVGAANATTQPLRDFNSLRQFVSGNGAVTVFDTPWMPIYILVMFMFHPVLGWLGVISALVMVAIAILNQKATAERLQLANAASQKNLNNISRDLANAEVIAAMGMFDSVQGRWNSGQNAARALQEEASQRGGVEICGGDHARVDSGFVVAGPAC